jgi:outer membrane lipoprotein-sorting protein
MPELGDVQLLHEARERWRTIRMRGFERSNLALSAEAFLRDLQRPPMAPAGGSGVSVFSMFGANGEAEPDEEGISMAEVVAVFSGGDPDRESANQWGYWEDPGRRRAEYEVEGKTITVVYQGDTFWSWSPPARARTNAGRANESHGLGGGAALLDTVPLLSSLRFLDAANVELCARPALRVRAEPRSTRPTGFTSELHALGGEADAYLLDVDEERGILLRCEARIRDRTSHLIEATEVSFDEELPDDTFAIHLPEGLTFESGDEHGLDS